MTRLPRDRPHPQPGTSSRAQIAANRSNAQSSTGPKSLRGKHSAARNALRHGLAVSIWADPSRSQQVENFSELIAGQGAEPSRLALARRIAEAQIDLNRVRTARFRLLACGTDDPEYRSPGEIERMMKRAMSLLRIHGNVPLADIHPALVPQFDSLSRPLGAPERAAAVIADVAEQLARLGRYETRALSRRKTAIRAFDAARFARP